MFFQRPSRTFFGLLGMAKHRMGTTKGPEITCGDFTVENG
jgi:hypothetical protein